MNRTPKATTIKAFHHPSLDALKAHALALVRASNVARHRKALVWRTPFRAICDTWFETPCTFKLNPHHLIPGQAPWASFAKSALAAAGSRRHARFRKAD
ncbi:MAG: hypothetical protein K2X46_15160 [Roseomonas sp.]|nr:hypothetical protein [Roseomonas sp.]